MLRFLTKPTFFLRLGFGLMYLYSGYDLVVNPKHWQGFITDAPKFINRLATSVGTTNFLRFQGLAELAIALGLLAWFLPTRLVKWLVLAAVLEMAAILVTVGINLITFRDLGLLGGLAGLLLLVW